MEAGERRRRRVDPRREGEDLEQQLRVEWAPYDPEQAEEALAALAEFLVAAWLRQQGGEAA